MGPIISRQHLALTLAIVLALCLLSLSGDADRAQASLTGNIEPNQIIVKLDDGVEIGQINSKYGTRVKERFLGNVNTRIYLLKANRELTVSNLLNLVERLGNDPRLLLAEPNFLAAAPEDPQAARRHRAFPEDSARPTRDNYSDPEFAYPDSALNLSSVPEEYGGEGTTVAVLDTGAQLGHPALEWNFAGVARRDFVDDDPNPSEPPLAKNEQLRDSEVVGHGTHVAGIVDLVAPKAKIMPLRVLDRKGRGNVFDIAQAISFASANGADVINLSLGTPAPTLLGLGLTGPPRLLQEEVEAAIDGGAVVVAAAGNSGNEVQNYPAAQQERLITSDGILAVTSVNREEKKSSFANYGTWVDVSAPGENILSTYPVSTYAYWSGTSMATPFVAGQAALIYEADGAPDPADVEETIRRSARFLDFYQRNLTYLCKLGAGHTDIGASLGEIGPEPNLCLTP